MNKKSPDKKDHFSLVSAKAKTKKARWKKMKTKENISRGIDPEAIEEMLAMAIEKIAEQIKAIQRFWLKR